MTRHLLAAATLAALWVSTPASAAKHLITGQVIDRNGEPVSRAVVSLSPGNVELVTDREGRYLIDYLRDDSGERVRLERKVDYTLEVFKPGFHTFTSTFFFKKGELVVDTVTMVEETIDTQDFPENLDPALYSRPTQAAGANYEGQ